MKVEIKESFKGAPEGHTTFKYNAGDFVEGIHAKFALKLGKGKEVKQVQESQDSEKPKAKAKKTPKPKNKKTPKPDHEG